MAKIRLILAVKSCYDSFILYPYNGTCAGIFIAQGCPVIFSEVRS